MNCEGIITTALSATCQNHPSGFERIGILINRSDINFGGVAYHNTKGQNVITTMPLNSGKVGYKIVQFGTKPFNGTKKSGVSKETAPGKVTKVVQFFVPDHDPDVDNGFIDALLNGEFVAILEHKDKNSTDDDAAFEIIGFHNGLHFTDMEQDEYSDYGSGWLVTMEETEAPVSSLYLFDTSYSATKTKFNAYLISGGGAQS